MKTQNISRTKSTYLVITILLVSFLFYTCKQQTAVDKIDEEQKAKEELMIELTYTCFNIWVSGNLSLVDEVYSPELIRHEAGHDDIVGIEAYKEIIMISRTAFPDINLSIDEIFIKDDKAIYRFTITGTHTGPFLTPFGEIPPTGKKIDISCFEIDRIVDGKIVEEWVYYDNLTALAQLGFTITPPESPDK